MSTLPARGSARRLAGAGALAASLVLGATVASADAASPSATPSTSTPSTSTPSTSRPLPAKLDNPFVGADQYLNRVWSDPIEQFAMPISSMMHFALLDVASRPTAVWLRRYSDVTDPAVLAHHLDEAAAQQRASGRPVVMTLVLDARPGNQCSALTTTVNSDTAPRLVAGYRQNFLAPLAALLTKPEYAGLRYAVVIEPGSMAQVVTEIYTNAPRACPGHSLALTTLPITTAALDALAAVPGAYAYLDGGSAGQLGWEDPLNSAGAIWTQVATASVGGKESVAGFATNVGDYVPWTEPFITAGQIVAGAPARSADFLDWSVAADEKSYTEALRAVLTRHRWPESVGFLVDTARNGWGGPDRPTEPGPTTRVDDYVDASRVDRRKTRPMWCNQSGAGFGARPQTAPEPGVDAFVWVKNPGASDGGSPDSVPVGHPTEPLCNPQYAGGLSRWLPTGALKGAPPAGELFLAFLVQLTYNAYPPLHGLDDPTPTPTTTTTKTTSTKIRTTKTKSTKAKSTKTKSTKPKTTKPKTTKPKTTKPKTTKPKTTKPKTTKTRSTKPRPTKTRTTKPVPPRTTRR